MANQRVTVVKKGRNMMMMMLQWRILGLHIGSTSKKWVIHQHHLLKVLTMGAQMPQWAGSGSSDNEITEIIGLGQHRLASNSASSGQNSTTHSLPLQSHTSYNKHPENGHDNKKIQLQVIMIILKMRIDNLMSMRTNLSSSMWVITLLNDWLDMISQ